MIDLHIHICASSAPQSFGLPAGEALRFAVLNGYRGVGLILRSGELSHPLLAPLFEDINSLSLHGNIEAILGIELVHIPPALLPLAVDNARQAGAGLVLVHGESLMECVEEGTNFAAIEAGADILAHPGLIDEQAAAYAAERSFPVRRVMPLPMPISLTWPNASAVTLFRAAARPLKEKYCLRPCGIVFIRGRG